MSNLIPLGAVVTLMGLSGLVWCIIKIARARKQNLDDDALKAVMEAAVPINLASLFMSAIGLMMVVLGIVLR